MSGHGRIRNFNQPQPPPGPRVLGASEVPAGDPQVLDSKTKQEAAPIEVVAHEETITEEAQIRHREIRPGDTQVRLRAAPTREEFDKIKRGEDE